MDVLGFLIDLTVRATSLVVIVWLAVLALRRASAAVRHAIWVLGMGGLLLLPLVAGLMPRWSVPVLPGWGGEVSKPIPGRVVDALMGPPSTGVAASRRPVPKAPDTTPRQIGLSSADRAVAPANVLPGDSPSTPSEEAPSSLATVPMWPHLLVGLWLAGAVAGGFRLLRGLFGVRRLRHACLVDHGSPLWRAVTEVAEALGCPRPVQLRVSTTLAGPLTWGLIHPEVVLPATARQWPAARLRSILVHELAHVRRMDWATHVLARLAVAVYWFHPLVWLAHRKQHLEQERACDDVVLANGCRASDYAASLMEISQSLEGSSVPYPAAGVATRCSELMARMTYLLDGRQCRGRMSWWVRVATSVLGLGGIGLLGSVVPWPAPGSELVDGEESVIEQPQVRDDSRTQEPAPKDSETQAPRAHSSEPTGPQTQDPKHEDPKLQDPKPQDPKPQDPKPRPLQDPAVLAVRLIGILDIESHRELTIRELAGLGAPAIPALERALKNRNEVIVTGALEALGKMHGQRQKTVPLLIPFVADRRADVATTAIRALSHGQTGDQRIREALLSALEDRRAAVVVAATEGLTRIHSRRGEFSGDIIALLQDPREQVVMGAMRSLPHVVRPTREVVPLLIPFVTDKREGVALCSADILAGLGTRDSRVAPTLIRALEDERPGVVCGLIRALGKVRGKRQEFAKALIVLVDRADHTVVETALDQLVAMTSTQDMVVPLLLEKLEGGSSDLVARVIRALASMGPEVRAKARPSVEPLAKSKNGRVAGAAARFLRGSTEYVLVADYSDNTITGYDRRGKPTFQLQDIFGVWDVENLANDNLLITEFSVSRVREITRDGKEVWSFTDLKNPYDADRLPNGNTLIADTFGRRVIEVDTTGKIVWCYDKSIQPYDVDRLTNGNTLIADGHEDRIIEVDKKGDIVWQLKNIANVHDADRLPNGNTLLTIRMLNLVREVDRNGKTIMEIRDLSAPSDADRLPNGNTIVAENGAVREFDRNGKQVWLLKTTWAVEVHVPR